MDDKIPSPAGISFIGAVSVLIFYWLHLIALGVAIEPQTGIEITLFISAFLAQYLPLTAVNSEVEV